MTQTPSKRGHGHGRGPVLVFELGAVGASGIALRPGSDPGPGPGSDPSMGTSLAQPSVSGGHRGCFGLEVTGLLQVIEPTKISPVPLAPAVVLGIMSFRGRIVTVVDPAPILGLNVPAVLGPETRVLLLRQGQSSTGNVGLHVSKVQQIVPANEMKRAEVAAGQCIRWVAQHGQRLINIVHVEPMLDALAREFGPVQSREPRQGVG